MQPIDNNKNVDRKQPQHTCGNFVTQLWKTKRTNLILIYPDDRRFCATRYLNLGERKTKNTAKSESNIYVKGSLGLKWSYFLIQYIISHSCYDERL